MQQGIRIEKLTAYYGEAAAVRDVNMSIPAGEVTAIIGPSGCGKSTFLRCLNRMHEVIPGARVEGHVFLDGTDIYGPDVNPVAVRRRVGMVFQRPTPFPSMSIYENVMAGHRLLRPLGRRRHDELVEHSLRQAGLWDEVKDRLHQPGASLSGGQQQRLCVARALAVEPEVILMDEPTSALDPISTAHVEDLVASLRGRYTVIIVTHNMQQAARIADQTAFFLNGDLVEFGPTGQLFTNPADRRTEDYVTGRFG